MSSSRYRFGLFEFDAGQQVLRRNGTLLRLQAQPARIMACLLEYRDRVVSRDELRQAVWGSSTYVEFDGGLNFCIAQIRSTLGDDSASPIYIRTVPKVGYQFIAPVEVLAGASAGATVGTTAGTTDAPVIHQPPEAGPHRSTWLAGLAVVLLLLAFVGGYELRSRRRPPAPPPIIAVARFDNETGKPELTQFTDGLTDNVVERLTVSSGGRFDVIGNAKILRSTREHRDLNVVAATLNAKYVVLGQVLPNGEQTLILAHLIRLPEQTHIWVARMVQPALPASDSETQIAQKIAGDFLPRVTADIRSGYSSPGLGR